ncbi:MAG: hypothetical protein H6842_06970 [Rhodospirillaceae bacterium]|jgi:hypothetical protein|nr:hypothetical protein [Rhodospirillaceae bacterium]
MPDPNSRNDKEDLILQLDEYITDLILMSNDSEYNPADQKKFGQEAITVRKRNRSLKKKAFTRSTSGYTESTDKLTEINKEIDEAEERIENLVDFFDKSAKLAGALDKLIGAAKSIF